MALGSWIFISEVLELMLGGGVVRCSVLCAGVVLSTNDDGAGPV